MNTSLAYCENDLQLLFGDNMLTRAGPSNVLQSAGGHSHGEVSPFESKQSTIPDFPFAGRNSPFSDNDGGLG